MFIKNFGYKVYDIDDLFNLVKKDLVTIKAGQDYYCMTAHDEPYTCISIKEEPLFDSFIYGVSQKGHAYGRLDISINNIEDYNLNCYTAEDYRQRINDIEKILIDKFGVHVDFSEAKYQSIEINKTFEIDDKFSNYSRVTNLLFCIFPKKLRLKDYNNPASIDDGRWGPEKKQFH